MKGHKFAKLFAAASFLIIGIVVVGITTGSFLTHVGTSQPAATVLTQTQPSTPTNLVTNGGFETGDLTGWTLNGNDGLYYGIPQIAVSTAHPHTGTYNAALGPVGSDGTMTQNIPTTPGQQYTFSFWLANRGGTPNDLKAKWNGTVEFSVTNGGKKAYAECPSSDNLSQMAA